MLNPFPHLLTYMLVAPFILRLVLGYAFLLFGYNKLTRNRREKTTFFEKLGLRPGKIYVLVFGVIECIAGLLLVAGFYTQIAALVSGLILLGTILIKWKKPTLLSGETILFVTLFAIALSLLFSGAGFWAFDVPL